MSKTEKTKRPTIVDVAKAAGVAVSTVSHALNNKGYVEKSTKAKILKAVQALGYRPNLRARGLRGGGSKTIALISAMPLGVAGGTSKLGFLMELAAVAAEEAMRRGLSLVLVPPQPSCQTMPQLEIDGALVVEPTADDACMKWLYDCGLPAVALGRWVGHDETPYVDLLSADAAALLLRHLKESGARKLAVMLGEQIRFSYLETERVYLDFCREQGQEPLLYKLDEIEGEIAGQVCAAQMLRDHPDVDGLLALVDAFAVGAARAAEGLGVKVPQQLKIATRYDGLRAKLCRPPLTALNLHLDQVAAMGVELLARLLNGDEQPAVLWPAKPELVARESTVAGPA
ncbi:LacI family DNA-binding transcriptional regulator [Desulfovibrio sp. OttesenSCG-928-C14]|nr:LacI family DNA-binding transcriptional regulator [Desulfovibrio sp. OttesenSCG-928-C14]